MENKPIGPSFYDELVVAKLAGLPFAWSADGQFTFSDDMNPEQIAAVQAVYEAHDPTVQSISELEQKRTLLMSEAQGATVGMADAYIAQLLTAADVQKFRDWAAYKLALSQLDFTQKPIIWPAIPTGT
jgi:hypothetical protein